MTVSGGTNAPPLAKKDIMLVMGLLRGAMLFLSDGPDVYSLDTFEVGMWASSSMALRIAERALRLGIALQSNASRQKREVISDEIPTATVEVVYLVQYVVSIVVFVLCTSVFAVMSHQHINVDLSSRGMLGWWALDKCEGNVDVGFVGRNPPKANAVKGEADHDGVTRLVVATPDSGSVFNE